MYQVAIIPNDTTANLSLSYKKLEDAQKAYDLFSEGMQHDNRIKAHDDYGFQVSMKGSSISYILFVDVDKSQDCDFEKNMSVNEARERIGQKLETMGFKPQQSKPSRIIQ